MVTTYLFLLLFGICTVHCSLNSSCTQREVSTAYLDIAMDMITNAKDNMPSDFDCNQCPKDCPKCPTDCPECPKCRECLKIRPADCADLFHMGNNKSGVYEIRSMNRLLEDESITIYCDMETDGGGWTVIQRRGDFGSPKDYFYKDWKSYKEGFGKKEKDFWLGNDNIFFMTLKRSVVRFDLMDVEKNRKFAIYENFWIDDEEKEYTLHISGYSGNAGNGMANHNNQPFSTKDRRNDKWTDSCRTGRSGAWWYANCGNANLNGLYIKGRHPGQKDGVFWWPWKGSYIDSLEWTEIKIRPKDFKA